MGVSTRKDNAASLTQITDTNSPDGAWKADGAQSKNVYGSYVHGIFDKEQVADRIIQGIGKKKGIDTSGMTGVDYQTFKETQYDILAAELRKNLDLPKIYNILQEGI
jgi:adenosylcobyric acid synthase